MTFRVRLLIAFALAAAIPLTALVLGLRRQMTTRLVAQHERRVQSIAQVAEQDLAREGTSVHTRLTSLARALRADDRARLLLVRRTPTGEGDRSYLLDWAGDAMRTAGLDMLQLQDEDGRIVSSGHFRNEFDRLEPEVPRALATASDAMLVRAREPDGPFVALARLDSLRIGTRRFTLVGGLRVDASMLRRFAREDRLTVTLSTPMDTLRVVSDSTASRAETNGDVVASFRIPWVSSESGAIDPAQLTLAYSIPELDALRRDVDRAFLAALALVAAAALGLAAWLSRRLSEPLAALAQATSRIDLEGPELVLAAGRDDEIGTLARRLGTMATRLRTSATRLREAERRATIGDMARQVNHDIKNGLIPIRNVLRHLAQVQEEEPAALPTVFAERRATLDSSVHYLDTLARSYARLTPRLDHRAVDVNAIAGEVAASAAATPGVEIRTRLADRIPRALGDPVVIRRIIDNLLRNAIESIDGRGGAVTVATAPSRDGGVRITITDTGRGMSDEELGRVFDDFYTTKPEGTGLGLSVVRRLTADLHGSVRVESAPGHGTTFTIELPPCTPS